MEEVIRCIFHRPQRFLQRYGVDIIGVKSRVGCEERGEGDVSEVGFNLFEIFKGLLEGIGFSFFCEELNEFWHVFFRGVLGESDGFSGHFKEVYGVFGEFFDELVFAFGVLSEDSFRCPLLRHCPLGCFFEVFGAEEGVFD